MHPAPSDLSADALHAPHLTCSRCAERAPLPPALGELTLTPRDPRMSLSRQPVEMSWRAGMTIVFVSRQRKRKDPRSEERHRKGALRARKRTLCVARHRLTDRPPPRPTSETVRATRGTAARARAPPEAARSAV